LAIEILDSSQAMQANAAALERLADASGDPAFRSAARALFQAGGERPAKGGRPAKNDAGAIARAVEMAANGKAPSLAEAFRRVARARGVATDKVRGVAERYRRKYAEARRAEAKIDPRNGFCGGNHSAASLPRGKDHE